MLMDHKWFSRMEVFDKEEFEKTTEDYLFVIDQIKENSHFVGTVIKRNNNDSHPLNSKIAYKESSMTARNCDVPIYCVHKDNIMTEDEAVISTNRKVKGSRVKSIVYANIGWIKTLKALIKMRIIEVEDQNEYPDNLIKALDWIDHMYVNPKYNNMDNIQKCMAASKKYNIPWQVIRNKNIARMGIKRSCKKKWYENGGM